MTIENIKKRDLQIDLTATQNIVKYPKASNLMTQNGFHRKDTSLSKMHHRENHIFILGPLMI